jgi:hypothetical protein
MNLLESAPDFRAYQELAVSEMLASSVMRLTGG